jgi:hypothetical protein
MTKQFSVVIDLWDSAKIYEKVSKDDDGWLSDIANACLTESYDEIKLDVIGPKYFEKELITEREIPHIVRVKIKRCKDETIFGGSTYPVFVDLLLNTFTVESDDLGGRTIIAHYVFQDWYY